MPRIGQIILFPYDFAPQGFSFCNGNLVPVAQNQQLFKYLALLTAATVICPLAFLILTTWRGKLPLLHR